ncbi:Hypothetical protein LUCI_2085 [Lucifera butyrica]|uniref:Uncharacterized protein n=2 Tax=Lucifera butyrica TaxID=1351585 RepID=A0A498RCG9_9FIRM|nr:Hypothetical protein LUCI_2085 [Lucifera butyrica]
MLIQDVNLAVTLARTLWFNTYRGKVTDELDNYLATLRIIPCLPLDRSEVPADAPEVIPYLLVLVEDAVMEAADLIPFESKLSEVLLPQMQREHFRPEFCHFVYPSPSYMAQGNGSSKIN